MDLDLRTWFYVVCSLAALLFLVWIRRRAGLGRGWALLCRACLLAGVGVWIVLLMGAAGVAIGLFPQVLIGLFLFAAYKHRQRFRGTGSAYGTAELASPLELAQGGHLGTGPGLLVGKSESPSFKDALRFLLRAPPEASEEACRLFAASLARRRGRGAWVRLKRGTHAVCFAGTGRGKGTGLVIPTLLTDPRSMVILDPKGENAAITAEHRRRAFGHKVVLLDPFRLVTDTPDTYNPLDFIDPASPTALDEVRALAEALVIRTGEEKEPHWNDSAELWIWAMTSLVLHRASQVGTDIRNLGTVCTLLASPDEMRAAITHMRQSAAWDGMLARLGDQLTHFVDRELGSALTTANRHLRFCTTLAVAASVGSSSFNPQELRSGKGMSVYCILPNEHLRTQSPLARTWINGLMRACIQGGAHERNPVLWLLDEAAALGHMPCIDDAIERIRGFGSRLFFIYQSLGQLKQCFPDGRDVTFLSNMDVQIFFGVNDLETAKHISEKLGTSTIQVQQRSGGSSRQKSHDAQGQESVSHSTNDGWNVSEVGRQLAFPDEILGLDERVAVVWAPGVKPFISRLVRYYEPEFQTAPGLRPAGRWGLALKCVLFMAVSVAVAAGMGAAVLHRLEQDRKPPVQVAPNPWHIPPPPQWPQPWDLP